MTSPTGTLSRADLLRLIDGARPEEREALAALVGFERRPAKPVTPVSPSETIRFEDQPLKPVPEPKAESLPTLATPIFWRVISQRRFLEPESDGETLPLWARNWLSNRKPAVHVPSGEAPEEISLLHWPRVLGFLRAHLVYEQPSQSLDEPRLVRRLAEARPLPPIPRKIYRRWPHQIVLVLDRSDAVYPLWNDFDRLTAQLQHMLGPSIKIIPVTAQPHPLISQFEALLNEARLSPEAASTARWLILSDLGTAESHTRRAAYWQAFLRWLKRYTAQRPPLGLVNAPPAQWWAGLGQLAEAAFWDLDRPLRLSRGDAVTEGESSGDLSRLLAMLSMTDEARPRLLRKLRRLLPPHEQDVSWEIAAWNHPDVRHFAVSCFIDPARRPFYQDRFQRFLATARTAEDWPAQVEHVIAADHTGMRLHVQDSERVLSRTVNNLPDDDADSLVEAIFRFRDMPDGPERELLFRWIEKLATSIHPDWTKRNDKLGAIRYLKDREYRLRGESTPELDKRFDFIFAQQPEREYLLWQRGTGWGIVPAGDAGLPSSGSPLGALRSRNRVIEMWPAGGSNEAAGFWASGVAPEWASAWGEDDYGLWAELRIQNPTGNSVTQRLRWINPGRFLMGSPEDEAERSDDETRHEVILSQGFWLADTACTQALWEAVMGNNPSEFKGAEHPVEQISWEAAISFIQRLNQQVTGLRLPTEAEWEYACRAGTQTPFWFGANIGTDRVNYNGEYPYAGGKKGQYREETVEVKALPCNGWGLYQMHGNVLEWCHDWYGAYPKDIVTDPIGPEAGEGRVLRGGSWLSYGRIARCAGRDSFTPGDRFRGTGFRLARGQSSQQVGNQTARGAGQAARSDDGQAPRAVWS